MSERRIVQCFGTLVRPGKPARPCRNRYLWIAKGVSGGFGRKGPQACPNCGTLPNHAHPTNQMLNGEITQAEYMELLKNVNYDGTLKDPVQQK